MTRIASLVAAALTVLLAGVSAAPQSTPPQTDTFRFQAGRSRTLEVTVAAASGGSEIVWPDAAGAEWDTALLGVNVTADATGLPYVEIASGTTTDRQYFPAREAGPRWLNLSFLHGTIASGAQVSLRAQGVTLAPGVASLRLFSNHLDLAGPILVLAPHPDDAEIASFGLYAHRNATVVTMTVGNAGNRNYEAVFTDVPAQYQFKGHLRLIDSITVPLQGGIPPDRCFNLGYFDARLPDMHDSPTAVIPEMYGPNTDIGVYRKENISTLLPKGPRPSTWVNMVADLVLVLKKVNPSVIVAPHPFLDSHRDHEFTTIALAEALATWKKPVTLLLYTNHADGNYPYGPAGTVMSLQRPVNRDVIVDRVYSYPVSEDLQRMKLFAIESMHDIRVPPSRQYQLSAGEDRAIAPEKPGPGSDITYLRRGPRSNELYYTYNQESVKPMIAAFLAAWRPARAAGAAR